MLVRVGANLWYIIGWDGAFEIKFNMLSYTRGGTVSVFEKIANMSQGLDVDLGTDLFQAFTLQGLSQCFSNILAASRQGESLGFAATGFSKHEDMVVAEYYRTDCVSYLGKQFCHGV